MADKPRIAILGGGVGAVTAAIELSKPGWRDHFKSITIYQQGWRLGGKGASGRNEHLRIEEHGLHIWFGFYENAFRMMHACHQELDRLAREGTPRWPLAFHNVEDSFSQCNEISLTDYDGCGWKLWTADFFHESDDRPWVARRPGELGPDEFSVVFYASRCLHLAADLAWSLLRSDHEPELAAAAPQGLARERQPLEAAHAVLSSLSGDLQAVLRAGAHAFEALEEEAVHSRVMLELFDIVAHGLQMAVDYLRGAFDQLVRGDDALRRAWYVTDLMIAIVRGLIEDDVIANESFDVINDVDFSDWLLTHGAHRDSVQSALVRTVVYDLAFAYRGGDPQRPEAEAGTALRGLLRTFFTYRGALMWKMNAGMGDVVFAPLYELLIKRGVHVRFFHRVEAVRASGNSIEEIEIDLQADVPEDADPELYLRPRLGHPDSAGDRDLWPNDPTGLLAACGALADPPVKAPVYESWFAPRDATRVRTKHLRRGDRDDGFDLVVFGFPISCVPLIAPDLPERSPRWRSAVDAIETVPTQALQLWLDKPAPEFCHSPEGIVAGGFVEPFDTWADMYHLVGQERVPGCKPGKSTIAYFCNVLADSVAPPRGHADEWLEQQREEVKRSALRFLSMDVASLWHQGCSPLTRELYWERLVAPEGVAGKARLDSQFWRANIEPSERYVLSVPGSSACRIAPDDTGFTNLYAVGDWTSCTLNAGCVEAAAISGIEAANGIRRAVGAGAAVETIIGRSGP